MDLAITYAALNTEHTNGNSLWLQGGAVELHACFFRGPGAVASVNGLHSASGNSQVAPLDLVTVTFGPRYTSAAKRFSVFAQALGGEANGFNSNFATGSGPVNASNGTTSSASSLALQAGGGIDIHLTHRLALRPIQADYLRTQLPRGGTNVQNNFRVAASLVIRLSR